MNLFYIILIVICIFTVSPNYSPNYSEKDEECVEELKTWYEENKKYGSIKKLPEICDLDTSNKKIIKLNILLQLEREIYNSEVIS